MTAAPPLRRLLLATFAGGLVTLLGFKVALFVHSAGGGEGKTHFIPALAKMFLCFGWDVIGALLLTALVAGPLSLAARRPRLVIGLGVAFQAVHGFFVAVNHELWLVVGQPFEKAVIDLTFFNVDPQAGTGRLNIASSLAPYVSGTLAIEMTLAVGVPIVVFLLLLRPVERLRAWRRPLLFVMANLFLVTAVLVPILIRTRILHVHGLDRSPMPMLLASYLRGPLRRLIGHEAPSGDPFCLTLKSPVGPAVWPDNPLRQARPARTNVLVVFMESVGTQSIVPGGMPFLAELGQGPGGIAFRTHYTHWPQTMQSLFSILCSELPYPEYTPITYVNPAIPCVSLPEVMNAEGYRTALFTSGDLAFERQLRFYKHRRIDQLVDRNEMPGHASAWSNTWGIDERVTVNAALSWIDKHGSPFFLIYNMAAGHHPYEIPGRPADFGHDPKAEDEAQRVTLSFVDARLRELSEGLKARGLGDQTLLAVVSDHGPGSGRRGIGGVRDASLYEGSVHVPFALRGPQLAQVQGAVTFPTGHIDFAPTLLGLLGITPPSTMKGRDLTRQSDNRAVVMGTRPPLSQLGVVAGSWKLVLSPEDTGVELFDVERDPGEAVDRAGERVEVVAPLSVLAKAWPVHTRHLVENYAAILRAAGGRRCGSQLVYEDGVTEARFRR